MSDIVNPFIACNPVTGSEMFFGREDVFQFIRQTLIGQHRDNVIVLYGQRRTGKTSVLYQTRSHNVGLYKKISFLDRNVTSDLITQPVKDYYQVEPAAVERIYHITSGHPYYAQLLCHCLFNYWQRQRMLQVEVPDVDQV